MKQFLKTRKVKKKNMAAGFFHSVTASDTMFYLFLGVTQVENNIQNKICPCLVKLICLIKSFFSI